MKRFLMISNFILSSVWLIAQCPDPPVTQTIQGNSVAAIISNGGDLFFDGNDGRFNVPVGLEPWRSTIFAAGLWMGCYGENQNLKVAAQGYGRNNNSFDYIPGPLHPNTGEQYPNHCENYNNIWLVEKQDILDHLADFEDNGIIDQPITSIYAWPGNKNAHSIDYNGFELPINPQGWAPFFDNNSNGIYEPNDGDFPHPKNVINELIPEQISFAVFNDNKVHSESAGLPLMVEIQLTSWNFSCLGNHVLEHSLFTNHKIINRSNEVLDSLYVGLFVDFDNGCYLDDFIGCSPENDGFLVYNSDNLDGESSANDCAGVPTYGNHPPAQSVAFLNKKMDKFIFHNPFPSCVGPPGAQYPPSTPIHYYNYLRGRWNDGLLLTYGGSGYQSSGGVPTNWAFPDNPNDSLGWSLYAMGAPDGDRRALGSTFAGTLEPGGVFSIDMAHTYHGYTTTNHLESANQAYIELAQIQQMYDMKFNGWCNDIVAGTSMITGHSIDVFPNPGNGNVFVKSENNNLSKIEVYDLVGKNILTKNLENQDFVEINLNDSPSGIYFLKIIAEGQILTESIIVQ